MTVNRAATCIGGLRALAATIGRHLISLNYSRSRLEPTVMIKAFAFAAKSGADSTCLAASLVSLVASMTREVAQSSVLVGGKKKFPPEPHIGLGYEGQVGN